MPGFDGTGPAGMGPMTGGGRGWCSPYGAPYAGYGRYRETYPVPASPTYAYGRLFLGAGGRRPRWGLGRGFLGRGLGRGRGRGWRW
jgi:hypothetical protein